MSYLVLGVEIDAHWARCHCHVLILLTTVHPWDHAGTVSSLGWAALKLASKGTICFTNDSCDICEFLCNNGERFMNGAKTRDTN